MRHLHPGRRTIATGLVALAVSGAAAAVISVAGSAAPAIGASASLAATNAHAPAHGAGHRARLALVRLLVHETVKDTGLKRKTVMSDLRAGQTIDQIAGAKAGDVAAAALARIKARLDHAVAAHRMTTAQEQARLSAAQAAIGQLMGENLASQLPTRSPSA